MYLKRHADLKANTVILAFEIGEGRFSNYLLTADGDLTREAALILAEKFKSLTPEEIQALWELEPLSLAKKLNYGFIVVPKDKEAIKTITTTITRATKRLLAKCQELNEERDLENWLKPELTIKL